jgi:AcrR family transcriptional regulator
VARSDTKQRILEAALDLFASEGYGGTSIAAVERAVGLAAGTGSLYRHFRSKEELLHAAVEHEVTRAVAAIEAEVAAIPSDAPPAVRLRQTLRDIRRFDRVFRLALTEGDRFPELRATLSKVLGGVAESATWDRDRSLLVAVTALGGYHLLGLLQGRDFQGIDEDAFIEALVAVTAA